MKTTTYLLGAMVLGLFLCIAIGVATLYYFSMPRKMQEFHLSGEILTQPLPACRVLKIVHRNKVDEGQPYTHTDFFSDSRLQVAGTSAAAPSFSFPSSFAPFFRVTQQGDTVCITLDIPLEERQKHVNTPYDALWIAIRDLHLQLPTSVQQLEVSLHNLPIAFRSMQHDSLFCSTDGTVTIDSCHFQSLSMQADVIHYNSGTIDRLHMDLDSVRDWTVQPSSCHIDTEYLQGSGIHTVQRGECRYLRWLPKNTEASLQLSLLQAAELQLLE